MPRILPTADQALIAAVQFAVEQLAQAPKSLAGAGVSERTVYRIAAGEATGVQANHWFEVLAHLPADVQANVLASLMPGLTITQRIDGFATDTANRWQMVPIPGTDETRLDPIGQTRQETADLVQSAAAELAEVTRALADGKISEAEQQQVAHLAALVVEHAQRLTAQTRDLIDRRRPAKQR